MSTENENQIVVKAKVEEILKKSLIKYLEDNDPISREETRKGVMEILGKFKKQSLIDNFEAKILEEDEEEKKTREVLEEPLQEVIIQAEISYPYPIETINLKLVISKK